MEARYAGCMLGLALGDALGAPYEGGIVERVAWRVIARGALRTTDDTEMAVILAESLLAHGRVEPDALAREWAGGCHWSRGYGRGTRQLLRLVGRGVDWRVATRRVFPDGSYGNGAAMRIAPVALFHAWDSRLDEAVERASRVTHAHPLGIEGARVLAHAIGLALRDEDPLAVESVLPEYAERLARARAGADPADLGNSILAHESVVTAITLARNSAAFERMIEGAIALGGDTDTIGAMGGAVWGAAHGEEALPPLPVEDRERIGELGRAIRRAQVAAEGARRERR